MKLPKPRQPSARLGFTSSGSHWEVQDTLLEDIDRIEVIRAPESNLAIRRGVYGKLVWKTKD